MSERDLTLVRPFDDPLVMAGQGTSALELIEDGGELDVLLAPVGGGGLMAGCSTIANELCPDARMVGVEPEAGDDHGARSRRASGWGCRPSRARSPTRCRSRSPAS